ncbi:hypothetical protein H0A36_06015 [Endozoicomonas sp. SM1973]|uniref:TRAM domain-containing protein n=1 Tax=Spartinivicinus marinus TaxID=2994442 RepID=A0A853HUW8_9GAMM|nr:hypothetical protein [Spartinivicinus marinus]MCX4028857.1 hypothetical protein [Spartinivicinus marinus]NYZ65560.1 hypothetical protein [Spartinivicinus marinus]
MLDWQEDAQLDRVDCFKYSPVEGAKANELPGAVPEEVKQECWERFMATQQQISANKLQQKFGKTYVEVIIDEVGDGGAAGRTQADAPEIDGKLYLEGATHIQAGQLVKLVVEEADEYDMWRHLLHE